MDGNIDVVELCALLQCLGFTVKSLGTSDVNASQDTASKTVVINCQSSGLQVVLESSATICSCLPSFWQVSGVAGGKQLDKKSGSNILCTLPPTHRDRITRELGEMVKHFKEFAEDPFIRDVGNCSTSTLDLKTPEKGSHLKKLDTPTRYRSLDTLTKTRDAHGLPPPGLLQKKADLSTDDTKDNQAKDKKITTCRIRTNTLPSTTRSFNRLPSKTSSPIRLQNTLLDSLLAADKTAKDLKNKLSNIIKELMIHGNNESSMSSLALDVSKVEDMDSRSQFASSSNLSGLTSANEDIKNNRFGQLSVSTSNLAPVKPTASKERKITSLLRSKKVAPVSMIPKTGTSSGSVSKRIFGHIKSTIPKSAPKKDKHPETSLQK